MRLGIIITLAVLLASAAAAQVPETFSYQGVLTDASGDPLPDGDYDVRFKLYSVATGGSSLWSETRTVTTEGGLFSVILGEVTPFELPFDRTYWLELTMSGESAMTPRVKLAAVPYAIRALNTETVADEDWVISGDDVYHIPGQVAVGATPPAKSQEEGEQGDRSSSDAKLYVHGPETGVYGEAESLDNASTGRAGVYGVRLRVIENPGTGFAHGQTNNGVTGWNTYGDTYTFGLAGYTTLDNPRTGGVLGSTEDGDTWAALGYRAGDAQPWGVYTPGAAYVGATLVTNYMQMPTDAQNGYVLTSDYNGFAHWEPPTGGLDLPYVGSTAYNGTAFDVSNTLNGITTAIRGESAGLYGGTFSAARSSHDTRAVQGVVTATGNYDAVGVYGKSTTAENYGIGGSFEGGYKGVRGYVKANEANSSPYYGIDGEVSGVYGYTYGVRGRVTSGDGTNYGVLGDAHGMGLNYGIYGMAYDGVTNYAGYFAGDVHVAGTLSKGAGSFKIDHPLDPENKYLSHSFVESPDMMNIYNGNVVLDAAGEAWVTMPDWFGALNRDFRYQLTPIGGPGPNLYVAEKINGNRFKIAGGAPGLEVSWQVTGIRQDPYAEEHRIPVEEDKPAHERGLYLNPELYGQPESMGLHRPGDDRNHERQR
ncbi:MAG: hypothetical protein GF355_17540 [Candidatus Eisenbacteria bacterium]|nr:hypothetical protein [Candidatus Eisenbacteria bacterium]